MTFGRDIVSIRDRFAAVLLIESKAGAFPFDFRSLSSRPKKGTRELLSIEKLFPPTAQPDSCKRIAVLQATTIGLCQGNINRTFVGQRDSEVWSVSGE